MHPAYDRRMLPTRPLSQDQLRAFEAVVRTGSFTRAAAELHLSQPALSRRVANLEEQLEAVLVERRRTRVTLTAAGRRLFAFAEAQRALEEELVGDLAPAGTLRGVFRLAGLSSLVQPVVLPALAPFLRSSPGVQLELHSVESDRLARELVEGGVDFGLSDTASEVAGVVEVRLGEEEFVLVDSRDHAGRCDVFLDCSPSDRTTEWFLAAQPARARPPRWHRSFLHDEAGILLGVELGLGRAVKPRHSIPAGAAVRIDPSFTPLGRPVYLLHRRQRYYGRLHQAVRALVETAVRDRLERAVPPARARRRSRTA
jgi:DNA-binding transcriptional LysR family regulator